MPHFMNGAPDFSIDGKVALVTGAARGIGLGIVRALASAGCAVAIQDLDLAEGKKVARQLNDAGATHAIALGGNIENPAVAEKLVAQTVKSLGGLHILVNNASVQSRQRWTELSVKEFDRTMHANVATPMRLCAAAEPTFRRQRFGRIVNIGSIQQKHGNEDMLAYAMSKAALANMTIALARDLAPAGVTVNMISPGYFHTLRNPRLRTEAARRKAGARIPAGRVGEPRDCGGMALLLCSPAGEYITGQVVYVDGGLSVR
jgi:NAD(P)-dependent dehydrogenase (short-subunit alcohol dehydrogenase family)